MNMLKNSVQLVKQKRFVQLSAFRSITNKCVNIARKKFISKIKIQ